MRWDGGVWQDRPKNLLEMMFDEGGACGVALNMIQYIPHEFRKRYKNKERHAPCPSKGRSDGSLSAAAGGELPEHAEIPAVGLAAFAG